MADAYYKFPASVRHLIVSQVSQLRKHRKIHFSSKEIAMILQIYYTITGYRARLMTQSECVDFLTGSLGITNTQTLEGILRVTVQIRGSEKYLERSGIPAENFVLMLSVYLRGSLLERADMAFNIMDFDRDGMLRKQVEFRRFLTGSFATEIAATHADIDPDQPIRESIQYLENLLISDSDDGVDLKRFKEIALQQPWVVDCLLPISCCQHQVQSNDQTPLANKPVTHRPLAASMANQRCPRCEIHLHSCECCFIRFGSWMALEWHIYVLILFWSLLTILAAGICCTCCLLPFWITGSVDLTTPTGGVVSSISHLGLFRRCGYPSYRSNGDVEWIQGCGYYPALESVPHWIWRMALVLLILSACLLVFLACFVICAGACTSLLRTNAQLSRSCSYVYFLAGRCEIGWAYVLTIAGGVISIVLSGIPNLLQSLFNRNGQLHHRLPLVPSGDGKYPFFTQTSLPHMTQSWYHAERSTFMNGSNVRESARRRPHSLVVSPDPSAMWDLSQRLSSSVFGSIPEQGQSEPAPNKLSGCQSFATLPENDITMDAFGESKKGQLVNCEMTDSAGEAS
ncbi:hypothetical protein Aperf_G00000045457 [Anoplocephala perfoliata]